MDESQEAALIRNCQAGDKEAFRILVEQYRGELFGTAYLMMRDRGQAEDAVQNALVKIWKHIPSFHSKSSIKTWMVRIMINEIKQQFRKKSLLMTSLEEQSEIPSEQADNETTLISSEERRSLRQALTKLPPEQKEAIVLRYFSGLTIPEIAAVMKQPEGTIKSRLSRALERLNQILVAKGVWEGR